MYFLCFKLFAKSGKEFMMQINYGWKQFYGNIFVLLRCCVCACMCVYVCYQCNALQAQGLFLTEKLAGKPIYAVIGCGCSSATEKIAELSQFFGIPMVREGLSVCCILAWVQVLLHFIHLDILCFNIICAQQCQCLSWHLQNSSIRWNSCTGTGHSCGLLRLEESNCFDPNNNAASKGCVWFSIMW